MMKWFRQVVFLLLMSPYFANAGIAIESSRVIFLAKDRERSLMLSNTNAYPVIVQTWIDNGAPEGTPEMAISIPVIPLPGVFRLEPGEKKNLRLLSTQIAQPQDRESLYWLNVYEIPPDNIDRPHDMTALNVAIRLQLKLFFRPLALPIPPDDIGNKLEFVLLRQPGSLTLKVGNPTPYFVTVNTAQINNDGYRSDISVGMLSPFSEKSLSLSERAIGNGSYIYYMTINDDGNNVAMKKQLRFLP